MANDGVVCGTGKEKGRREHLVSYVVVGVASKGLYTKKAPRVCTRRLYNVTICRLFRTNIIAHYTVRSTRT